MALLLHEVVGGWRVELSSFHKSQSLKKSLYSQKEDKKHSAHWPKDKDQKVALYPELRTLSRSQNLNMSHTQL